jgi:hypothetical protein
MEYLNKDKMDGDSFMDEVGVKPIQERFLYPNYLFAMEFREGWIFGRVVRRRICQYKPYRVVDSTGAVVDIAASSAQAELRLRDPRNPDVDVLFLDTSTNSGYPWFLHGSIGIKPEYILAYLRYPEGKEIPGKFPEVDPIKPSSGDFLGYINSTKSPYDSPTDYVELVITPHRHIGVEYYNIDPNRAHQPVLNLYFALYWFQPLNPKTHARLISRIAARDVPAAFFTVGFSDLPEDLGDTLKVDWKVEPMSLDSALALAGVR